MQAEIPANVAAMMLGGMAGRKPAKVLEQKCAECDENLEQAGDAIYPNPPRIRAKCPKCGERTEIAVEDVKPITTIEIG